MTSPVEAMEKNDKLVKILEETEMYTFGNLFRVIQAKLCFRKFDGALSEPITRINFERGDSVGILLYDPNDDNIILVRQFRYPVLVSLRQSKPNNVDGSAAWLLEIVAGIVEEDLSVKEIAHKEILEEAGYSLEGDLQPIHTIYPSPGGSSERIYLFLGHVNRQKKVGEGGGLIAEGENVQVQVIPFTEAMTMIASGEINDAKTIIALQHLALQK